MKSIMYVHGYGSRVMDELKLETITMIEDPSMIFKMIKQSLTFESSSTVTIEKVEIPKKLIKLANKSRKYIQNRERLRLRRTYIFSIVRNIFLNMGRNFVKENRIDDERDQSRLEHFGSTRVPTSYKGHCSPAGLSCPRKGQSGRLRRKGGYTWRRNGKARKSAANRPDIFLSSDRTAYFLRCTQRKTAKCFLSCQICGRF